MLSTSIKNNPGMMTTPKGQTEVPETNYLGIHIFKCSDKDFKLANKRKFNALQVNNLIF